MYPPPPLLLRGGGGKQVVGWWVFLGPVAVFLIYVSHPPPTPRFPSLSASDGQEDVPPLAAHLPGPPLKTVTLNE
jgi:hypothetical protein